MNREERTDDLFPIANAQMLTRQNEEEEMFISNLFVKMSIKGFVRNNSDHRIQMRLKC